ncbi:MAG: hypothetical protein HRT45_10220 [Bdellovibrionales bacterium]|nr:hypothetical protein [Bdellovibrionales bacterium]
MENSTWIAIIFGLLSLNVALVICLSWLGWLVDVEGAAAQSGPEDCGKPSSKLSQASGQPPPSADLVGEAKSPISTEIENNVIPMPPKVSGHAVMFNWNGHLWEAHEVLGVRMGSTMAEIEHAYTAQCEKVDPHSRAILKMALRSIHERVESPDATGRRNK